MLPFYAKYNNKTYKEHMGNLCVITRGYYKHMSDLFLESHRMTKYDIDEYRYSTVNREISLYNVCGSRYRENKGISDVVCIKDIAEQEKTLGYEYFRNYPGRNFSIYLIKNLYAGRGLRNLRNLRKKYSLMWKLIGVPDILLHIYEYVTDTRGRRHYNIMMNSINT